MNVFSTQPDLCKGAGVPGVGDFPALRCGTGEATSLERPEETVVAETVVADMVVANMAVSSKDRNDSPLDSRTGSPCAGEGLVHPAVSCVGEPLEEPTETAVPVEDVVATSDATDTVTNTATSKIDPAVSISFESYREEGIAHFFANEHRAFHPTGSGRASGASGSSLVVGSHHAKPIVRPSAAFRGAVARKSDSGLDRPENARSKGTVSAKETVCAMSFRDTSFRDASCQDASCQDTACQGVSKRDPRTNGMGDSLPFPDGFLNADPLRNGLVPNGPAPDDRVLAHAFEQSACGLSRKDRVKMRTIGLAAEKSRLKKRTTMQDASDMSGITLPIIRLADGDIDLSDPPKTRRRDPEENYADPNLLCLIDVWPTLPRRVRDAVMTMIRVG